MTVAPPVTWPLPMERSAVLSDDRVYRYRLRREWDAATPKVLFVMLNPSTADEHGDDATVRRCIRYARDWGYGGLLIGNLFAFRATNPRDLPRIDSRPYVNPVGELSDFVQGRRRSINDDHLRTMAREAGLVVAAWGATRMPQGWESRPTAVLNIIQPAHALRLTGKGHPHHPLRLPTNLRPFPIPDHEHEWSPWVMYEGSQERRHCACGAVQCD